MGLKRKRWNGKKEKAQGLFFRALGVSAFLLAWYLLALCLKTNGNNGVPYPWDTFRLAFSYLFLNQAASTWAAIGWTLLRIAIAFLISFTFGAIIGVLGGIYPRFREFMSPLVSLLRAIPTVAVVLMLISILMGIKAHVWLSWIPVALSFVVCFPLFYQSFSDGIRNERRDILDSLKLEGAERKMLSVKEIYLPDSWPYIKISLAQSFGLSFKVSIMAEVLTSSSVGKVGIGTLIVLSRQTNGGIEEIPAYSLIVLLLMALIDIPFYLLKRESK